MGPRGLSFVVLAAAAIVAGAAEAGTSLDAAAYRARLAEIDALQAETLSLADALTGDALGHGLTRAEAKPLAAHMSERLDWLRGVIVAASVPDRATLRHDAQKGPPPYGRCLVWRAGGMEDHVQDVATNLALAARGAAASDLIPLDRAAIESEGLRNGCPR